MQVQTVLGPISPQSLGRTLTHEHFFMDGYFFYTPPPAHLSSFIADHIRLDNVGLIKQYPYSSKYNITFCDGETRKSVLDDVVLYKKWGGGAIVENSSNGLERNLRFLYDVAQQTGVHVIAGTGHYIVEVQSVDDLKLTIEELTDLYTQEIVVGSDVNEDGKSFVKCGFIGEVGSSWPMHDFEKRSIQATGAVQETLGCGVSFHPGRNKDAPFEILRLYLEAGGKANKCVMSHLDRTLLDIESLLEFAASGVYCQFDLFGTECSYYQLNPTVTMPSDADRIDKIVQLANDGHVKQLLMSHDIHTKHRLLGFGGHGYAHIINNVLPRLIMKGLTADQIDQITIKNPANWLQFNL